MTNPLLTDALISLLQANDGDTPHDLGCDWICDYIENGDLSLTELEVIRSVAHYIDPTESFHAAHIRDAFRDGGY